MRVALIGAGAIAGYLARALPRHGHEVAATLLRPARLEAARRDGLPCPVAGIDDLPAGIDCIVECAGHAALAQHGRDALARGHRLVTVSIGALADAALMARLADAARAGGGRLLPASGAIGALDALRAARVGRLEKVRYSGRKPPAGWRGSPAEAACDLDAIDAPFTHFTGTARAAALAYPKNANVAAAVALAGAGFEATEVALIADPGIGENIHVIEAEGDFGRLRFEIAGKGLPDNPRSSALAAMSALAEVARLGDPLGL